MRICSLIFLFYICIIHNISVAFTRNISADAIINKNSAAQLDEKVGTDFALRKLSEEVSYLMLRTMLTSLNDQDDATMSASLKEMAMNHMIRECQKDTKLVDAIYKNMKSKGNGL